MRAGAKYGVASASRWAIRTSPASRTVREFSARFGIPYRTLPGTGMPAYFTRGTGHNEKALYSERPDDFVHNLDRLTRKFDTARQHVPAPVADGPGTRVGIIAYGTTHWAIEESRDQLVREAVGMQRSPQG